MYDYKFESNNKLLNPLFYEELLTNPVVFDNNELILSAKYKNGNDIIDKVNLEGFIYDKFDAFELTRDLSDVIERTNASNFFYIHTNNIFNPLILPREIFFIYDYKKTKKKDEYNHMKMVLNRVYDDDRFKFIKKYDKILISGFEEMIGLNSDSNFFSNLAIKYNSLKLIYLDEKSLPKELIDINLKQINKFIRN